MHREARILEQREIEALALGELAMLIRQRREEIGVEPADFDSRFEFDNWLWPANNAAKATVPRSNASSEASLNFSRFVSGS